MEIVNSAVGVLLLWMALRGAGASLPPLPRLPKLFRPRTDP